MDGHPAGSYVIDTTEDPPLSDRCPVCQGAYRRGELRRAISGSRGVSSSRTVLDGNDIPDHDAVACVAS